MIYVNMRVISEYLAGSKWAIRNDKIPKCYQAAIDRLLELHKQWEKEYPGFLERNDFGMRVPKDDSKKNRMPKASNSIDSDVAPGSDSVTSAINLISGTVYQKGPDETVKKILSSKAPDYKLDTSGKFEEFKPKERGITTNGKCYRVYIYTNGKFIEEFFPTLDLAIERRNEIIT